MWYETAVPVGIIYALYKVKCYVTVAGDRMNYRGITDPRKTPYRVHSYWRGNGLNHQFWYRDAHMATDPWAFKWFSHEWRPITEWKYPYDAERQW